MKQTTLDLNGPILSFVTNPQSATICAGAAATFTGIATVTYPLQTPGNPAVHTGIITYRWYDQNGPLFDDPPPSGGDGVTIIGAGTTVLTLFNNRNVRNLFLRAEYLPSAYGLPGVAVTVGSARSTGNAINEPINSNTATLNLIPNLEITSEPLDITVARGVSATFQTTAALTDGTTSLISYQWQLNGQDVNDGTIDVGTSTVINPTTGKITIIDDSTGQSTVVDFGKISTYSNFITGRTYTLISDTNINTKIIASGAGGGSSSERSVAGGAGGLSTGEFTFVKNQTYKLIIGGRGVNAGAGGFAGGGAGGRGTGLGGGGGGYTGLFLNSIVQSNSIIIAGGGGGGANDPALGGTGGGITGGNGENANRSDRGGFGGTQSFGGQRGGGGAQSGAALQGGAGAAGGGGGYFGGGGGNPFDGCCADGAGGGGSGYLHPTLLRNSSTTNGAGSVGNGTFSIQALTSTTIPLRMTISGTKTSRVTISSDAIGINNIRCKVSHPTACNTLTSPLITRTANFTVTDARNIIKFEAISDNRRNSVLSEWDLSNGSYTVTPDFISGSNRILSLYAPEKDILVNMDIFATKGNDNGGYLGGQGGRTSIRFTMRRNEEYIIAEMTNTGGGGVFIYRKASLIACVGGGGNAGASGNGGDGGGIGIVGENGRGRGGGNGGSLIATGTLPADGYLRSGTVPGRTMGCPGKNQYWIRQGFSLCQDVGTVQFRKSNGTIVSNTASITRGFKAGYSILGNGGLGSNNSGNGGNGVIGGHGGTDGGGGGGASGYTDGSVTVISSQLGGSTGPARIVISAA